MANTTVNSGLRVTKFLSEFYREYVRKSRFAPYTGTTANNIIVIKEGKQKINVPLVTRLVGNGVTGSATLRGNGEAISNYYFELTPTYYRHAVEFDREEMEKPNIDLMEAARPLLMDWSMELQRTHIIRALGAIYNGTTYANYGSATNAAMDTWLANNDDRVLFGATKSNHVSDDMSTSLAAIDTTTDKMSAAMMSVAKRIAQTASPHIRPIRTENDKEMFVCFHDPYAFRNLSQDSNIRQAQREVNGKGDPIFEGGGFVYEGILHIEVPEIADLIDGTSGTNGEWGGSATANGLHTAGDSSSRVGVSFLCGQQALGYGLGQKPRIIIDRDHDYQFQPGVAVELKHDIKKAYFNNVQHGVVTIFSSAAVDA
jgi:hypothetical protein